MIAANANRFYLFMLQCLYLYKLQCDEEKYGTMGMVRDDIVKSNGQAIVRCDCARRVLKVSSILFGERNRLTICRKRGQLINENANNPITHKSSSESFTLLALA